MIVKFCNNKFSPIYKKTLGVDFLTKRHFIKEINKEISYCIWDTAGQEIFDSITRRYYKGADCAIIVFSMIDRYSFQSISSWNDKIKAECGEIPIILAMTKIDLKKGEITIEEAKIFASAMGFDLVCTSSKNGIGVTELFERLVVLKEKCEEYENELKNNSMINDGNDEEVKYNTKETFDSRIYHSSQIHGPTGAFKLKIIKYASGENATGNISEIDNENYRDKNDKCCKG